MELNVLDYVISMFSDESTTKNPDAINTINNTVFGDWTTLSPLVEYLK